MAKAGDDRDICDFDVGLSRQLYGLSIAASGRSIGWVCRTVALARPRRHHSAWIISGRVGALVKRDDGLGVRDTLVWKPSETTLAQALACQEIVEQVCGRLSDVPPHVKPGDRGREAGQQWTARPSCRNLGTGWWPWARCSDVASRLGPTLLKGGQQRRYCRPFGRFRTGRTADCICRGPHVGQRHCTTARR